jgi:hypothetical protein
MRGDATARGDEPPQAEVRVVEAPERLDHHSLHELGGMAVSAGKRPCLELAPEAARTLARQGVSSRGLTATDLARRILLEGAVVDGVASNGVGEPAGRQSV